MHFRIHAFRTPTMLYFLKLIESKLKASNLFMYEFDNKVTKINLSLGIAST